VAPPSPTTWGPMLEFLNTFDENIGQRLAHLTSNTAIFANYVLTITLIFEKIWYMVYLVNFSRFGMLYQEKSGNPDVDEIW
jgi:hypothetical protein